jgi:hypothetical protein
MRDVLQAARAHTIHSTLIFLDLLECEPESVAELRLAHPKHLPAHADLAAYVFVDGVGDLFCYCLLHDSSESLMRDRTAQVAP